MLRHFVRRNLSAKAEIFKESHKPDTWTNITDRICEHINRQLYLQPYHPLSFVRERIVNFFYDRFRNSRGNPLFSVYDHLDPVVSVHQNFDSLLVPENHVSRGKSDCFYLNKDFLLRGHMTAHQVDLLKSGLDNFLMIGDVYRRDQIDQFHYPVFHQIDGVRLLTKYDIYENADRESSEISIYRKDKVGKYNYKALDFIESELKSTLTALAKNLFYEYKNLEIRWVNASFPFTNPSWELEVKLNDKWLELLGCGVIQREILDTIGIEERIGWAFGLGLERIAMYLYQIPDIRLFWSNDSGFLGQFKDKHCNSSIIYKEISKFPQCINNISFWLPPNPAEYSDQDFYELVRTVAGNLVEHVELLDEYRCSKSGKVSKCFKITYRHMEKTFSKAEVNVIHAEIEKKSQSLLNVQIR